MPKDKFKLSKKHEFLIEKIGDIPSMDEIQYTKWARDLSNGKNADHRYNTEDALLQILEMITKGTQMEEIALEISEKARAVFDYYADRK